MERDLEYLEVPTRNMISSDLGNKVLLHTYYIIRFIVQIFLVIYSMLKQVKCEKFKKRRKAMEDVSRKNSIFFITPSKEEYYICMIVTITLYYLVILYIICYIYILQLNNKYIVSQFQTYFVSPELVKYPNFLSQPNGD